MNVNNFSAASANGFLGVLGGAVEAYLFFTDLSGGVFFMSCFYVGIIVFLCLCRNKVISGIQSNKIV